MTDAVVNSSPLIHLGDIGKTDLLKGLFAFGVPICGTLGLVLRAARKGLITNPAGVLTELRDAGMWLEPRLFQQVLSLAREFQ